MERRTIYFELGEQVTSALNKIKRAGSDDILIVAPKGARLLHSLTTLKLLKNNIDQLKKTVHFATSDAKGTVLLRRAGFVLEANNVPSQSASGKYASPQGQRRMGDIVGRVPKKGAKPKPLSSVSTKKEKRSQERENELSTLIGPKGEEQQFTVPEHTKIPLSHYTKYIVITVIALALAAVLAFFVLPKADITVTARSEDISRELDMLVDGSATAVNSQDLIVPGSLVEDDITESKTFVATGKKPVGKQATGTVRIRNFSNNSLVLRKETTRLEIEGKIYRLQQDIGGLKPTTRQNGEANAPIDESSLTNPVTIVADQPGADYNVPQGTRFEVINEVFGHQPEVLFAVNDSGPVAGGTDESVSIISEEDVAHARAEVDKGLVERLRSKLIPGQRITADGTVIEVVEEALSNPVGTETGQFQLTRAAKVRALAFDENQVATVIADRIIRLLPENKHLVESETKPVEANYVSLDLAAGSGTLRATYKSLIQYSVNREFLQSGLRGKSTTEVKEILLSRPEVQDVDVKLWPFWVRSVPVIGGKVNFKVVE